MAVQVIPDGASVVVTDENRNDMYVMSERVKDAIAKSDLAEAAYFHRSAENFGDVRREICETAHLASDDISSVKERVCAGFAATAKDTSDTQRYVAANTQALSSEVKGWHLDTKNAVFDVSRQVCETGASLNAAIANCCCTTQLVVNEGFAATKAALAETKYDLSMQASANASALSNIAIAGFKDGRYDAATNTSALQASICELGKDTALAFKDAQYQAAEHARNLSAQMAECCCSLKEKVAGVTDALKQQEIDRLREEVLEMKIAGSRRSRS